MKVDFRDVRYSHSLDDILVILDDNMILQILESIRTPNSSFFKDLTTRRRFKFFNMLRDKELSLSFAIELQKGLGIQIVTQEDVDNGIDCLVSTLRQDCVLH
jgi:hypothetical protein